MNYRIKWLSSICSAALMLALVTSCADGVDDDERFSAGAGVTNAQLEAPQLSPDNIKVQTAADGSQSVDVSWPVIMGAGGYLANVNIVNDPTNPIVVVKDSIIDGCHFAFPREVDTKYEITVSTLGNEKLNNKGSLEASKLAYSTLLPATVIPVGNEISSFIAANLPTDGATTEAAFELEAGRTYELTGEADCKLLNVTIRGDRYDRPTIVISGENGSFVTQNGLTLRNVNIDMSDAPMTSLIRFSANPDASLALPEKVSDATCYVCDYSVSLESCNIRNLPGSIITQNNECWALNVFLMDNCVVQFNKQTSEPAIDFDDRWEFGCVKTLSIKNSTFYNTGSVTKCRFIRYGMRQNGRITKAFGEGSKSEHSIVGCTLYKTFPDDQFANNMPEDGTMTVTIDNTILYDISRPDAYFSRSGKINHKSDGHNLAWLAGADNGVAQTIRSEVKEIATVEDPNFVGPTDQMFDLLQPLGGVSFRPQISICFEEKIGDPRWLE